MSFVFTTVFVCQIMILQYYPVLWMDVYFIKYFVFMINIYNRYNIANNTNPEVFLCLIKKIGIMIMIRSNGRKSRM